MAVQYDSKNDSWSTWISRLKVEIPIVSAEADAFFKKYQENGKNLTKVIENVSKNNGFEGFIKDSNLADESIISFLKDTNYATKTLENYQLYLKNSANSMAFFQKAVKKTGTVLKSLGGTLASMAIMWAASELISLAVKGIDTLIHKSENAIKAAEEAQDAIKSIKSDLDSMNKTIEDSAARFAELSEGVDRFSGKNLHLSTDEYSEFLQISNNLAELFPTLSRNYTENGDAIIQLSGGVDTIVGSLQNLVQVEKELKKQEIFEKMDTVYDGAIESYKKSKKKYDDSTFERDVKQKILDKLDINELLNPSGTYEWYNTDEMATELSYAYKQALEKAGVAWSAFGGVQDENGVLYNYLAIDTNELKQKEKEFNNAIEEIASDYSIQIKDLNGKISTAKTEMGITFSSYISDLVMYFADTDDYSKMSSNMQNLVTSLINSIDLDSLKKQGYDTNEKIKTWIQTYIINPLSFDNLSPDQIQDINNSFAKLFDMKSIGDINLIDFVKQLQEKLKSYNIEIDITPIITDDEYALKKKADYSLRKLSDDHGISDRGEYEKLARYTKNFTGEQWNVWFEVTDGIQGADKAIQAMTNSLAEMSKETALSDIFSLKDSENNLTELGKINEEIDKFQSAYATLKETMDSYNETGTFTLDQVQGIVALGDEYLKYLMDENGELQLNEEALNNVAVARINEMRVKALSNLMDNLESITNEKDALSYLETQLLDTAQSYDDFTKSRIRAWTEKALESGEISEGTINRVRKAFENQAYAINEMFDKIDPSSVYTKSSSASKSAAKDATDNIKDQIEAYMSYQKASLESGKIDYNTYCNTVKNYLTNMYHSGKIAAEDYHTYIGKMLDNQLKVYNSALKAILSRIQKEIDAWQKKIDDLKDANEKLTDEQEVYNKALSYAQDLIQKQIDGYDDLIDKIDESSDKLNQQKDDLDGILSAIYKVYDDRIDDLNKQSDAIQEQIDLLNDENSALDLQYRKQQALAALDKAKQQRTKKIYSEEKGFFYTQDEENIREKEKNLQDIQNEELIASLNKEKDALADSVKELEKYKDLWSEISDFYENEANKNLLIGLFGDDYEDKVLENNILDIEDFKKNYLDIQQKLNDNEELKKSYEEKKKYYDDLKNKWGDLSNAASEEEKRQAAIKVWGAEYEKIILEGRDSDLADFRDKYLEIQKEINSNEDLITSFEEKKTYYGELKEQWSSISSAYEEEVNKQYAAQLLGAGWEKDVLSGRLDILEDFKKKYIDIQKAITDAAEKSAKAQYEAAQAFGNAQVPSTGTGNGTGDTKQQQYKAYIGEEPIGTYDSKEEAERAVEAVIEQRSDYSAKKAVEKLTDKRNANQVYESTKSGIGSDLTHKVKIEKFHTGLLNGIVGESSKKNDFEFLKQYGLKKVEIPAILQKGEAVLTEEQIKNLAYNLRNSGVQQNMMKTPDYSKMANSISTNTVQQPITITFGDIHVEGVQNAQDFTKDIVRRMPNLMFQQMNKR